MTEEGYYITLKKRILVDYPFATTRKAKNFVKKYFNEIYETGLYRISYITKSQKKVEYFEDK